MAKQAPTRLKRWRMANGLTHEAAGARFGTTRMTWLRWESGLAVPGPGFMIELYSEGVAEPNDFYDLPALRVGQSARAA